MGRTAQAATGSGGLLSAWGRIDDGAGKVMRSMGGLNDVLDIAKLALGVGLSGPIGAVVMGLGELFGAADLVKGMFGETATATKDLGAEQAAAAVAARDHAKALGEVTAAGSRLVAQQLGVDSSSLSGRAVLAGTVAGREMKEIATERARLEQSMAVAVDRGSQVEGNLRALRAALVDVRGLAAREGGESLIAEEVEAQRKATADIARTIAELDKLGDRADDARRALREVFAAPDSGGGTAPAAARRGTPRVTAVRPLLDASRIAGAQSDVVDMWDAADAAADRASRPVVDTSRIAEAQAEVVAMWDAFEQGEGARIKAWPEQLGEAMAGFAAQAVDTAGFAASAIQSVAGAIGTSMANMVAGVGKGSKGLRTSIGDIALMLSQQAFTFATYLGALGVVASIPGLNVLTAAMTGGATAPTLFTAAAVMGGVGLSLGLTARAFGTSQSGGASARASSGGGSSGSGGGSSGGGFGSFGPSSDRPIEVTVILSADALHDSVVTTSGQRARSGSISSPRLAVAGGF
jgi:uncharacterized membrane protein YgcG